MLLLPAWCQRQDWSGPKGALLDLAQQVLAGAAGIGLQLDAGDLPLLIHGQDDAAGWVADAGDAPGRVVAVVQSQCCAVSLEDAAGFQDSPPRVVAVVGADFRALGSAQSPDAEAMLRVLEVVGPGKAAQAAVEGTFDLQGLEPPQRVVLIAAAEASSVAAGLDLPCRVEGGRAGAGIGAAQLLDIAQAASLVLGQELARVLDLGQPILAVIVELGESVASVLVAGASAQRIVGLDAAEVVSWAGVWCWGPALSWSDGLRRRTRTERLARVTPAAAAGWRTGPEHRTRRPRASQRPRVWRQHRLYGCCGMELCCAWLSSAPSAAAHGPGRHARG